MNNFKLFVSLLRKDWWHASSSSIAISSESRNLRVISSTSHIFWFWYECSAAVLILLLHYVDINWFLPLSTFSFHFYQIPLLIHLISLYLTCIFELKSLSPPLSSILFWSFCFLHFFGFCKCCLSWIRLGFCYG